MSLGNNIKKFRKELGLTQEELAGILCVTSQAVSKWESEAGLPDTAQIVPLARALNVSRQSSTRIYLLSDASAYSASSTTA